MKINAKIKMMNKEAQKNLTGYELETLKKAYNSEWKETDISENIEMFAALYTGENGAECLSFSAEMAFNKNDPNVWCESVFRAWNCYVEAGFYLTDAWEATGDNNKEIQNRAYIRRFDLRK